MRMKHPALRGEIEFGWLIGSLVVTKKGKEAEKVDINLFDDTADVKLILWGSLCSSTAFWKPSNTILLITRPGLYGEGRPILSLTNDTYVDVDPSMTDATWLRGHAQRLTKREHVNQPFPEGGMCLVRQSRWG